VAVGGHAVQQAVEHPGEPLQARVGQGGDCSSAPTGASASRRTAACSGTTLAIDTSAVIASSGYDEAADAEPNTNAARRARAPVRG
jgi:hypothetical protein